MTEREYRNMKLILRADDVGFSEVGNIGVFKAIDEGVITHADVMMDTPGSVDAFKKLRERPWISVGWHAHNWGDPVLSPNEIPSLLNKDGKFKWAVTDGEFHGADRPLRSREQMIFDKNDVDYDEAVKEFRAEILRCIDYLGKAPDTGGRVLSENATKIDRAINQVADEFGMKYGWYTKGSGGGKGPGFHSNDVTPCLPQYKDLDIFMPFQGFGTNKHMDDAPGDKEPELYNPLEGFRTDGDHISGHKCAQLAFHPACIDDYMTYCGGYSYVISRIRIIDLHTMCSQEMKEWIKEQKIELVNQRDAIYGSQEYQNHLKYIESDLAVR